MRLPTSASATAIQTELGGEVDVSSLKIAATSQVCHLQFQIIPPIMCSPLLKDPGSFPLWVVGLVVVLVIAIVSIVIFLVKRKEMKFRTYHNW